jgi:RNA polymerase sigma-70 factor (ECF subfamily)
MASDSDRLLIEQIRAGEPRAWQTLIDRYEGRLLAYAQRRLRDRGASEDVVQETFIGFLNSLPNFDLNRELQTYLFTIASHKLTDYLRKCGRNPLRNLAEGGEDMLEQQHARQPTASSLARSEERRDLENEALARSLGQMVRYWREKGDWMRLKVMELLWVKGMANRDVAALLGVSEQQVANYRFSSVKKLAELIRNAGLSPAVFPELQEHGEE